MIKLYIKEYIGEFESVEEAEKYCEYQHYNFDENTQPMFVEVEKDDE